MHFILGGTIDTSAPPERKPHRVRYFQALGLGLAFSALFLLFGPPFLYQPPRGHSNVPSAQKSATDLRSAIIMYQTEYKRWPALPGMNPSGDTVINTSGPDGLISVLVAIPGNPHVPLLNRREIIYFTDRAAKTAAKPGLWRSGADAHLRDPWGNYFLVHMDTDYDNQLVITYPNRKVEIIYNVLAVRSLGKNGVIDNTPGYKNDDIVAQ